MMPTLRALKVCTPYVKQYHTARRRRCYLRPLRLAMARLAVPVVILTDLACFWFRTRAGRRTTFKAVLVEKVGQGGRVNLADGSEEEKEFVRHLRGSPFLVMPYTPAAKGRRTGNQTMQMHSPVGSRH